MNTAMEAAPAQTKASGSGDVAYFRASLKVHQAITVQCTHDGRQYRVCFTTKAGGVAVVQVLHRGRRRQIYRDIWVRSEDPLLPAYCVDIVDEAVSTAVVRLRQRDEVATRDGDRDQVEAPKPSAATNQLVLNAPDIGRAEDATERVKLYHDAVNELALSARDQAVKGAFREYCARNSVPESAGESLYPAFLAGVLFQQRQGESLEQFVEPEALFE